ncbi:DUF2867 domain-containing protein [Aquimarina gracilis]|uniref:DUF2867 domain-containing protein n=1 Tax=Aquimarina gracilis TaxID=874422 RepID=A0ABU5ZWE7_9FLAO|nr:DUF2867 domain-containing protein [Aquimarina gracilis]MEB3346173.1 DUF2867 domain-containing protein [Aquimarina gracilis]
MKIKKVTFPEKSILFNHNYDYSDSYSGNLGKKNSLVTSTDIGRAFFISSPKWIGLLMTLRNKIVSIVGLKTGTTTNQKELSKKDLNFNKGDHIGVFKVFNKTETELILGEDDKHLNFRVSLFIVPNSMHKEKLIISTIVIFNNWFGKLYFLPVKVFHRFIVKSMLKKTIKSL